MTDSSNKSVNETYPGKVMEWNEYFQRVISLIFGILIDHPCLLFFVVFFVYYLLFKETCEHCKVKYLIFGVGDHGVQKILKRSTQNGLNDLKLTTNLVQQEFFVKIMFSYF